MYFSKDGADTMSGYVFINNSAGNSGTIQMAHTYDQTFSKVEVASNSGGFTHFGSNGGKSTFPSGASLSVHNSGYTVLTLYLNECIFVDNQDIGLTGTATLNINNNARFQQELATSASTIIMQDSSVTGALRFNGSLAQAISSHNATIEVQEVILDKASSQTVTLNKSIDAADSVNMIGGVLISSTVNMLRMLNSCKGTGGNDTSFITGPVQKIGINGTMIPLGGNAKFKSLTMTNAVAATDTFQAEYKHINPNTDGYVISSTNGPIENVSNCEYWLLDRVSGSNFPDVTLFANDNHCYSSSTDPVAAIWNSTQWEKAGAAVLNGSDLTVSFTGLTHLTPLTYASGIPIHQDFFIMFEN